MAHRPARLCCRAIALVALMSIWTTGCADEVDCTRAFDFFAKGCFTNCDAVCSSSAGAQLECYSGGGIYHGSVMADAHCQDCATCLARWTDQKSQALADKPPDSIEEGRWCMTTEQCLGDLVCNTAYAESYAAGECVPLGESRSLCGTNADCGTGLKCTHLCLDTCPVEHIGTDHLPCCVPDTLVEDGGVCDIPDGTIPLDGLCVWDEDCVTGLVCEWSHCAPDPDCAADGKCRTTCRFDPDCPRE